jgi:biopolymer transport protein ExbD
MYNLIQSTNSGQHRSFVKKPKRRNPSFSLRLTSMIDVFTILLVFLLKSYSAEGQIMSVAPDLSLPVSTATKDPMTSSVISITTDLVLVDGRPLLSVKKAVASDTLLLKNLYNDLRAKRIMAESVSNLDERMAFRGEITIQGDEDIPFEILKKVMYTCGQVGYNNILLAVTTTTE